MVILANLQNREENVQQLFWQIFKNGRKMSVSHSGKLLKLGGKCLIVILANCVTVIQRYKYEEENVQYAM